MVVEEDWAVVRVDDKRRQLGLGPARSRMRKRERERKEKIYTELTTLPMLATTKQGELSARKRFELSQAAAMAMVISYHGSVGAGERQVEKEVRWCDERDL